MLGGAQHAVPSECGSHCAYFIQLIFGPGNALTPTSDFDHRWGDVKMTTVASTTPESTKSSLRRVAPACW